MNIKDEVINVEITYEELSRILMPDMASVGFEITQIEEIEIKQLVESGEFKKVALIRFKRSRNDL